jgi:O-phospho-L-seryl-tRNASec:L-selenocysteinyl-tRNA synthase
LKLEIHINFFFLFHRTGRVDVYVQSTDKNFMVPVGGSIIAGFNESFISKIGQCYPGRASSSPILDLFITLLSIGSEKYIAFVRERKELHAKLRDGMASVASKFGLRVLDTPGNSISVAMTLPPDQSTELGSKLFLRCVSGTRVVTGKASSNINGIKFEGWGAHTDSYPGSYLTAAATIGMKESDIELFLHRLEKVFSETKSSN